MSLAGIDVSNNNGAIPWDAVAGSGVQFALCKASEGTTFSDLTFAGHMAALAGRQLGRGAYHFAQPDRNLAGDEAAWFLAHARPKLNPGDVVALDLEAGGGDLRAWALTWLRTVEAALGCKPLLYSSPGFMAEHNLTGDAELATYGLWLASWGVQNPQAPPVWPFVAMHQYSSTGRVAGIVGDVDLNTFNGDLTQFRAYGLPAAPAKLPFTDTARLQLVGYVAGGSGVADLAAWLAQHEDVTP